MSRSSAKSSRSAPGCFLILFGILFGGFGFVAAIQGALSWFGRNSIKVQEPVWLLVVLGTIFGLIGTGIFAGGIYTIRHGNRRRPHAHRAQVDWQASPHFPKAKTTRSPSGRVMLRAQTTPLQRLILMTIVAVIWNGLSWTATYFFWETKSGADFWIPLGFISIFLLIGVAIIGYVIHTLTRILMVGETSVEIDREPLCAGECVRMALHQKGDFEIDQLRIALQCEEIARYQVGTDTKTTKISVHEALIAERQSLRANSSAPILTENLAIPFEAMHSFKASSNEIVWSVRVKMTLPGRPDIDECFPIRITPQEPRQA